MRLRTWISLLFIAILVISATLTLVFSINVITHQTDKNIAAAKVEYFNFIKHNLQDVTSLAFSILEKEYADFTSGKFLKRRYGGMLKELADYELCLTQNNQLRSICPVKFKAVDTFVFRKDLPGKSKIERVVKKTAANCPSGFIVFPTAKYDLLFYKARDKFLVVSGVSAHRVMQDAQDTARRKLQALLHDKPNGYILVYDLNSQRLLYNYFSNHLGGYHNENSIFTTLNNNEKAQEFAAKCMTQKVVFEEYEWPKPRGPVEPNARMSSLVYAKYFVPWRWVVGTSAATSEINLIVRRLENEMAQNVNMLIIEITATTLIITAIMVLFAIVFASSISNPIRNIIEKMRGFDWQERKTGEPATIKASGCKEMRELCTIFNKMQYSLNEGIQNITDTMTKKQRLESHLEIADAIQGNILPNLVPAKLKTDEFDVCGKIVHGKVHGGDLYDFFYIDDDHLCFALGDVSGSGVSASLFMLVTRTLLHAKAARGLSAGEIVTEINKSLCASSNNLMHVHFILGIINVKTGRLSYSRAGQIPACLLRDNGVLEVLPVSHGDALGVSTEQPYYEENINFNLGDKIVLITDSILSTTNYVGDDFGEGRLQRVISKSLHCDSATTVGLIFERVNEFIGTAPLHSDLVALVLSWCSYQ